MSGLTRTEPSAPGRAAATAPVFFSPVLPAADRAAAAPRRLGTAP
ncbi:hypothetical protein [Streptomyces sp. enrichment culture]